jgi:hypothetical protein
MVFLELDFFMFHLYWLMFCWRDQIQFFCCDLQMNQAPPGSACHGFGAADDIHLGEDRFDV